MPWSYRINDPQFHAAVQKQRRSKNRWTIIFMILALIVLPIIGVTQDEVGTFALIGVAVAAAIGIFSLFSTMKAKMQSSWEGVVTEKYQKEEERIDRTRDSRDRHVWDTYNIIIVQDTTGKKHKIEENNNRWSYVYHYFNVGDRIKFHGGMDLRFPYEKFDKSADAYIHCPFCAYKAPNGSTHCPKCHLPLLS